MSNYSIHQSVLTEEVIKLLQPKTGGIYLDTTFGGGGHSRALLKASEPEGKVVAIDRDPTVEKLAQPLKQEFGERFQFQVLSYDRLENLGEKFDGILFDLGLSSDQLESSGRGFSFQKDEPLDLRFDPRVGQSAAGLLAQAKQSELETVFRDLAEDRYWRVLVRRILENRRISPIKTTTDFVRVVGSTNPAVLAPLFQGLRIKVNDELNTLSRGLGLALSVLNVEGSLAVISFHSLEDRLVKQFLKENNFEILTKKPIRPSWEEITRNPRSRSAKLRAGRLKQ